MIPIRRSQIIIGYWMISGTKTRTRDICAPTLQLRMLGHRSYDLPGCHGKRESESRLGFLGKRLTQSDKFCMESVKQAHLHDTDDDQRREDSSGRNTSLFIAHVWFQTRYFGVRQIWIPMKISRTQGLHRRQHLCTTQNVEKSAHNIR